ENVGIVFGSSNDASRSRELANILTSHEISVYGLSTDAKVDGSYFTAANSYYVPFDQSQYKLIKTMFETVTSFEDSLFYDVSAWTLPMAFNLDYQTVSAVAAQDLAIGDSYKEPIGESNSIPKSAYAYAFKWGDYYAPRTLGRLLEEGVICKVAQEPFKVEGERFERGSVVVPVQIQSMGEDKLHEVLTKIQSEHHSIFHSLSTGRTHGVNLGSSSLQTVKKPSIAVLVEEGVNPHDAGEIWHLLDTRFDMPPSLIPIRVFNRLDLERYNTIVLANGRYDEVSAAAVDRLKNWVYNGGKIIAFKGANTWLNRHGIISIDIVKSYRINTGRKSYSDLANSIGAQATGGSIFAATLDTTHPIGYGYVNSDLSVFVNSNVFFTSPNNPYSQPLQFTSNPLRSGYVSKQNLSR
ncbi:MAG: hypothetical protein MI673_01655, partial [Thiotrichales bacterium]|nr:hypothetical protein [Thiotrichales bacterium]